MKFLKTREVAELMAVTMQTVRNLRKSGELKAINIGKQWRFLESDVMKYIGIEKKGD